MSQISRQEAVDLLQKLFDERTPLRAFLISASRVRASVVGFVDSMTLDLGLVISPSSPPTRDISYLVLPWTNDLRFDYGESRELDERLRANIGTDESSVCFTIGTTGDVLALFFRI